MKEHPYLDYSLAVLQVRLMAPMSPAQSAIEPGTIPFVTMSREAYAGATTVSQLLVPMLNNEFGEDGQSWALLDRNLLTYALKQEHLEERLAKFLPEDRTSVIQGAIGELVGLHPSLWQLEEQVARVVLQLAHLGRVVLVGRAAHLITKSLPGGFHVRLVAPLETRIERMMAHQNCSEEVARTQIRKTDLARRRYVKDHFNQDIDDAHTYDMVINTGRVAAEAAMHLILEGMCQKAAVLAERRA